jgi:hypothetical protein
METQIQKKLIIIFISVFVILIVSSTIGHYYYLKNDYKAKLNFVVAKKKSDQKGLCRLYDNKGNKISIKSHFFSKNQVYVEDSIVKKENSYLIMVYRKRNWKDYGNDDSYFVAEKIELDK